MRTWLVGQGFSPDSRNRPSFFENQVRGEAAPKPTPRIPIERSANVPRERIDEPLPKSRHERSRRGGGRIRVRLNQPLWLPG
jgi:hypothetical protein